MCPRGPPAPPNPRLLLTAALSASPGGAAEGIFLDRPRRLAAARPQQKRKSLGGTARSPPSLRAVLTPESKEVVGPDRQAPPHRHRPARASGMVPPRLRRGVPGCPCRSVPRQAGSPPATSAWLATKSGRARPPEWALRHPASACGLPARPSAGPRPQVTLQASGGAVARQSSARAAALPPRALAVHETPGVPPNTRLLLTGPSRAGARATPVSKFRGAGRPRSRSAGR